MKAANGFVGDAIEYTYAENVSVKAGVAVCKTRTARDALYLRGYNLLEEIPVDLGDARVSDIYFTTQSYAVEKKDIGAKVEKTEKPTSVEKPIKGDVVDLTPKKTNVKRNK